MNDLDYLLGRCKAIADQCLAEIKVGLEENAMLRTKLTEVELENLRLKAQMKVNNIKPL
jgi:hypothetical protein